MVGFFIDMEHDRDAQSVISKLGALDISDPLTDGVTTEALLDTIELLLRTAAGLRSFSATGLQKLAGELPERYTLGALCTKERTHKGGRFLKDVGCLQGQSGCCRGGLE